MDAVHLVNLLGPWLGRGPTYRAVASGLRGLALDGRLPVGARIPSERHLARALGVGRNTVTAAYDVLRLEGYLCSAHGAGSRVALPVSVPARPDSDPEGVDAALDLTVAALPAPAALLPAVDAATLALRPLLAGHGLHPMGLPALREAIARHLTSRGLVTDPRQVLVTNGALHGWDLMLRTFGRPGERVLVEQPTYPAVLDAVASHRLRPVPLPVSASGWDLPVGPTALAHVTPDAQNPTGLLASDDQRRDLHDRLRGRMLAIDETFADLVLEGPAPRPMGALGPDVVTLGSMSKAFWAGLRIGWVRGRPEVVARLAQVRAGQDLASPVLEQLIAVELLDRADQILPERRGLLLAARDTLVRELGRRLPGWRFAVPRAGMVLWVELPAGMSATRLASDAMEQGIRITAGPRFTVRGTGDRWLRLPFTLPPERIVDLVAQLEDVTMRDSFGSTSSHALSRWTA
jgi:DNA-binding transcriptional MocR family regulator